MVDGAPTADPSEESTRPEELPDRLRVHSLARTLGTTSKRVLDALSELDGRIRSAHSTVDRDDAVRVRDLLAAAQDAGSPDSVDSTAAAGGAEADAEEPESRLMLQTPDNAVERPHYMPLFVAPQPIDTREDDTDADEGADTDDSDTDDDEQADRPSNRRRRRGRRGRGRGRGEQGGSDGQGDGGDDDEAQPRGKKGAQADSRDAEDSDDQDADDSDDSDDSDSESESEESEEKEGAAA